MWSDHLERRSVRFLPAGVAAALLLSLLTMGTWNAPSARADTGCPAPAGSYAGGSGTQADPWQIDDSTGLQRLRDDSATGWDDSYILTADIDMSGCTWTSTIGNANTRFTGLLDGNGHEVSGLTITISGSNADAYAGLIGILTTPGVVTRVGFVSGSVSASASNMNGFAAAYAGGLVGRAEGGPTSRSAAPRARRCPPPRAG